MTMGYDHGHERKDTRRPGPGDNGARCTALDFTFFLFPRDINTDDSPDQLAARLSQREVSIYHGLLAHLDSMTGSVETSASPGS